MSCLNPVIFASQTYDENKGRIQCRYWLISQMSLSLRCGTYLSQYLSSETSSLTVSIMRDAYNCRRYFWRLRCWHTIAGNGIIHMMDWTAIMLLYQYVYDFGGDQVKVSGSLFISFSHWLVTHYIQLLRTSDISVQSSLSFHVTCLDTNNFITYSNTILLRRFTC